MEDFHTETSSSQIPSKKKMSLAELKAMMKSGDGNMASTGNLHSKGTDSYTHDDDYGHTLTSHGDDNLGTYSGYDDHYLDEDGARAAARRLKDKKLRQEREFQLMEEDLKRKRDKEAEGKNRAEALRKKIAAELKAKKEMEERTKNLEAEERAELEKKRKEQAAQAAARLQLVTKDRLREQKIRRLGTLEDDIRAAEDRQKAKEQANEEKVKRLQEATALRLKEKEEKRFKEREEMLRKEKEEEWKRKLEADQRAKATEDARKAAARRLKEQAEKKRQETLRILAQVAPNRRLSEPNAINSLTAVDFEGSHSGGSAASATSSSASSVSRKALGKEKLPPLNPDVPQIEVGAAPPVRDTIKAARLAELEAQRVLREIELGGQASTAAFRLGEDEKERKRRIREAAVADMRAIRAAQSKHTKTSLMQQQVLAAPTAKTGASLKPLPVATGADGEDGMSMQGLFGSVSLTKKHKQELRAARLKNGPGNAGAGNLVGWLN